MKVKIGTKLYDSDNEPIMLILSPQDRLELIAMSPQQNCLCNHPTTMTKEEILEFMEIGTSIGKDTLQ